MSRRTASPGSNRALSQRTDRPRRRLEKAPDPAIKSADSLAPEVERGAESGDGRGPLSALAVDRDKLHAEMMALREQYRGGASEAAANIERFEEMSRRVKLLLDEEFPGWESEPEERRSHMVTLYFQYRADLERAESIHQKFERLTRDIETLLSEEFPDWQAGN